MVTRVLLLQKCRWRALFLVVCLFLTFQLYLQHGGNYYVRMFSNGVISGRQLNGTGNISLHVMRSGSHVTRHRSPLADKLVKQFQTRLSKPRSVYQLNDTETYSHFMGRLKILRKRGDYLTKYFNITGNRSWERFHRGINQYYLYDPDSGTDLTDLLRDLNKKTIVAARSTPYSSHLAITLVFEDGSKGIFKAIRTPKEQEASPNHFYFSDIERPTAEIAAFHLDKVLAFYRVPPTVGRVVNITRDLIMVGDENIKPTAHRSPVGNSCFFGSCKDYCTQGHALCGNPHLIEGSVSAFLPNRSLEESGNSFLNPYVRSYDMNTKVKWEYNESFCETDVKPVPEYQGRFILDLTDLAVFDFLQGNLDRHHIETFKMFGNDTFLVHYDNGRGFGRSKYDCISCLAPVRQCCKVRLSTLAKLVKLYTGPDSLSQLLRMSLSSDPLAPILTEPHLDALDRRVGLVISTVYDCVNRTGSWDQVIVDDGVV
ncbi:extracellular serine/threonine protein CG31145-like [Physella acuta]|uniref:extracellular serine/threonine protein CG31145-like n=1 Tax=Physella acuta TaxID=109671 RepID=UPI0027DD16C3|nr:extracellular serine/threonine protein CG31145-like [Physella acuta]